MACFRLIAPDAVHSCSHNTLREANTKWEVDSSPIGRGSDGKDVRASLFSTDVVSLSSDSGLERSDVRIAFGSSGIATSSVSGTNHIGDTVRALATPDTIPSRLRTILARCGITLDGLENAATKVLLNEANVVRSATIPVEDDDVAALSVIDRYEVRLWVLPDSIDGIVGVEREAADCINLAAFIQAHADEQHTPPHRIGRSSKPLLSSSSSPIAASLGSGLWVIRCIVPNSHCRPGEDVIDNCITTHWSTTVSWGTLTPASSNGSVPICP
nr:MAG TPA: hypothetical protein [Caudoviricetes sp.]